MSDTYGAPFFFGGDSPGDLSYEQLVMRRKIAAALAARQRGFPKNLGEGLTYFGEALGDRLEMMRLARLENRYRQQAGERTAALSTKPGYTPGSAAAPAAPAGVAPPPRAATPPVPPPARAPAAAIDEQDPTRPSALDLAPPSPIGAGGAPPELAGPRQRAMDMETLDPAVANEMDLSAVYPHGAAPPSVEAVEPARQPSPEWQRLQDYQESQGRPRQPPPDPALMRPRLDATGEPAPSEPSPPQNYGPPVSEGGSSVDQFKAASAKLESGGRYDLLGPPVRTGGGIHRAYGKYQVMDFNIPKWTEKYVGQRMSPEEFLRDPQAQERVYEGEFGRLAEKYGPEGASRAWIGGEGGMNNLSRRAIDARGRPIGLSVGEYGRQFANAIGEQPTRAAVAEGRQGAPSSAVTPADRDTDLLLAEAVGVAGSEPPARPQVAAYAPDTSSDAPPIGLPMGYLPDMADTVQARRGAISGRLPQPPMTAPVPGPAGGEPAGPAQRLAQMPTLGGSPAIPDASMFSPLPTPGAQPQPPPMAPAPAGPSSGMAPAPPPGAVPPLAARPPGIAPAPPPGAVPPPAAPPPGIAPAPTLTSRPSAEPLTPAFEETMPQPGPAPVRAPPRPLSPLQQQAMRTMSDPRAGPDERENARRLYEIDEKYRSQLEQQDESDYRSKRERWEQTVVDFAKFEREGPNRRLEQHIKRVGLEKAIAEVEKAYYEATTPREQARIKADLDILEARRKVTAPDKVSAGGTQFERPYNPLGGPAAPYAVPAGLPAAKEEPLTEMQAKGLEFAMRVRPDMDRVDTQLAKGKALTSFREAAIDSLPGGIGNSQLSQEYRTSRDSLANWGAGFLTRVSGAAVSPGEAMRNLPAFIPRPGDSDADIDAKAQRRRDFTNAVEKASSPGGMKEIQTAMDKINFDFQAKVAPMQVKSPEEAKTLPPGQRFITPDGRELQVPIRRRP